MRSICAETGNFNNQLMINAYREAAKICYGDSIGLYFSEAYFSPAVSNTPAVANNGQTFKSKCGES